MTKRQSGALRRVSLALTFGFVAVMPAGATGLPTSGRDQGEVHPPIVGTNISAAGAMLAPADPPAPPPYHVTAYAIPTLAPDDLPYARVHLPAKSLPAVRDSSGIPMKVVAGRRYYSPAGLAEYGLKREEGYRRSADPAYLATASNVLDKLMAIGVRSEGGLFIPYHFDLRMHGSRTEVMQAPWYSAMAQGIALSLASRLYRDTGQAPYLAAADLLFGSFRHLGQGPGPWVTYVDARGYLWLEEYPEADQPDHTANGFNYAVFGLYDYWELTRDLAALQILRASLTTMREYVGQYRIPGSSSKYCLSHGDPQPKYHLIVTAQLAHLYRMSGDDGFLTMSRLFAEDYP